MSRDSLEFTALTGGETGPLVAAGELNVEVGDQGVDVVVPLHLQAERRGEAQVLQLHSVDVHLLENTGRQYVMIDWLPPQNGEQRWSTVKKKNNNPHLQ